MGMGDEPARSILHLFADIGIEDEVLHTYGTVTRVGIDPEPNPFSDVVQGDACNPPVTGQFALAFAHPPCHRWSKSTPGNQDEFPDYLDDAREVCDRLADHWIIENVPQAPLHKPVILTGGHFGLPIHYPRAFECSFTVPQPASATRWHPTAGPLAEQGEPGKAWVGTNDGWRLGKGYAHDWPARELKRHGIPAPYVRRLLYWWLTAVDGTQQDKQQSLDEYRLVTDGGTDE